MLSLGVWFKNLLGDSHPCVVTVIGSGGKTSLIWHLAGVLTGRNRRVLVTPTTKMFVPDKKFYDRYCNGVPPCLDSGVTLTGTFNEANGKLEALPPGELEAIIPGCDIVLIEGDGSGGLPLKAWAEYEPVVPSFTNITVGVLPLWPLGKPVSENLVHRLPLFTALTGAVPGKVLEIEHLLRLITGSGGAVNGVVSNDAAITDTASAPGLFAKARGKKVLFFNQVEDDVSLRQAGVLTEHLPTEFRRGLSGIIAGSVKLDRLEEL